MLTKKEEGFRLYGYLDVEKNTFMIDKKKLPELEETKIFEIGMPDEEFQTMFLGLIETGYSIGRMLGENGKIVIENDIFFNICKGNSQKVFEYLMQNKVDKTEYMINPTKVENEIKAESILFSMLGLDIKYISN